MTTAGHTPTSQRISKWDEVADRVAVPRQGGKGLLRKTRLRRGC